MVREEGQQRPPQTHCSQRLESGGWGGLDFGKVRYCWGTGEDSLREGLAEGSRMWGTRTGFGGLDRLFWGRVGGLGFQGCVEEKGLRVDKQAMRKVQRTGRNRPCSGGGMRAAAKGPAS